MHDSDLIAFPASHGAATLPFDANSVEAGCAVKHSRETRPLTFGGCIASVCEAYGSARAEGVLRFAVNSGILVFPGQRQVEIAPRDPRMDGRPNRHQVTGFIRYFLQNERDRRAVIPRSHTRGAPSAVLCFAAPAPEAAGDAPTEWMRRRDSKTG